MALLSLKDVDAYYGHVRALKGVDFEVGEGEIVCLLGANGAGKSTTLKTIMGLVKAPRGEVIFRGRPVRGLPPHRMVGLGITMVPEGRRIFPDLTVLENLMVGAHTRHDRVGIKEDIEYVFSVFPRLKERQRQSGGTLSGGEQQMLALGRALMSRPQLLMMDEPSMGLAPIVWEEILRTALSINRNGTSILLVEQNAALASAAAQRGYVMETGSIVFSGSAKELAANDEVARAYLGKR